MGEFVFAEHPEGCSLQLFYRTSPCKERGSARSAMGVFVYRHNLLCGRVCLPEHPEGCSLPFQKTAYIVSRETVQFAILYIATIRLLW